MSAKTNLTYRCIFIMLRLLVSQSLLCVTLSFKRHASITFPQIETRQSMSISGFEAPKTFLDCVKLAVKGTDEALIRGHKLIEVEFPPLPLEVLEDASSSAQDLADANTRWATEFAQAFTRLGNVSIIYPDQPELEAALRYVGEDDLGPNITLATIRADSIKNARSLDMIFQSILGATVAGTVVEVPNTALYVALVSSTQELPDLEKLHLLNPSIPIVFFNLRLDILRGDLGLPLFPGRDLHHRFLSGIVPAFLMRSRSYAQSVRVPPFIVNYSGLMYRVFPGPYQCILNTGGGKSKQVQALNERPTNVRFREAITDGLVIPGLSKQDLKSNSNNLVWWEKETEKEKSPLWRL